MQTEVEKVASPAEQDLHCPLCDYNLRGLTEPRCPECGHRSTWDELRNRLRLHPYLFEHHPERNVRSFLRTIAGLLLPRRFWRAVLPTMQIRPGRLYLFAIIIGLIALLSVACGMAGNILARAREYADIRTQTSRMYTMQLNPKAPYYDLQVAAGIQRAVAQAGSMQAFVESRYPPLSHGLFWKMFWNELMFYSSARLSLLRTGLVILLWAPLTLASLFIFRATLRQAKINNIHVMRCVIYSAAVLALVGPYLLITTPLLVTIWSPAPFVGLTQFGYVDNVYAACVLLLLILGYRLAVAYRMYLRFPHAIATVLASQVIVALVLLKIDMMLQGH
jgi:hypothetical protein